MHALIRGGGKLDVWRMLCRFAFVGSKISIVLGFSEKSMHDDVLWIFVWVPTIMTVSFFFIVLGSF